MTATYRVLLVILVAALASPPQPVLSRPPSPQASMIIHVPRDYPSITLAVEAAGPGASIVVEPGVYGESVVVEGAENLSIRGSGAVVLGGLLVTGSRGIIVEGLSVRGGVGVFFSNNTVLENMSITRGEGAAARIEYSWNTSIVGVSAEGPVALYTYMSWGTRVEDSLLNGSSRGLLAYGGGGVEVEDSVIRGGVAAAAVRVDGVVVRDSYIEARSTGIYLYGVSSSRIERVVARGGDKAVAYMMPGPGGVHVLSSSNISARLYALYASGAVVRVNNTFIHDSWAGAYIVSARARFTGTVFAANHVGLIYEDVVGSYIGYMGDGSSWCPHCGGTIRGRRYMESLTPKRIDYWGFTVHGCVFEENDIGLWIRRSSVYVAGNVFRDNGYALRLDNPWDSIIALNLFQGNNHSIHPGSTTSLVYSGIPVPYIYRGSTRYRPLGNYWGPVRDGDGDGVGDRALRIGRAGIGDVYDPAPLAEPPSRYRYPVLFWNTTGLLEPRRIRLRGPGSRAYASLTVYLSSYGVADIEVVLKTPLPIEAEIVDAGPGAKAVGDGVDVRVYRFSLRGLGAYVFHIRVYTELSCGGTHTAVVEVIDAGSGAVIYSSPLSISCWWSQPLGGDASAVAEAVENTLDPEGLAAPSYIVLLLVVLAAIYLHRATRSPLSS